MAVVEDTVAKTNEFPDIVGAKPENPYLEAFHPYIPSRVHLRELTILPIIVGTILGMIFGASSLYLVLKVGLTVSASIPVAVISITLFRLLSRVRVLPMVGKYILVFLSIVLGGAILYLLPKLGLSLIWSALGAVVVTGFLVWVILKEARDATILENNIVQTAGSAGESIAFGVGVTMPAIMILGFDLEFTRVMLVAVLGGLLGILMMIPLRRALIVQQHGYLKYPEGTACAEVLKAGADEESRAQASDSAKAEAAASAETATDSGAKTIFAGFGIGFLYQTAMVALKGWKDTPQKIFDAPFKSGSIAAEISPALLGVGYIIGPRIASIMCAGGVLAYLVLIPAIKFFGDALPNALSPATVPISQMGPSEIRGAYVLYIGAGAVAAGGIISLFRSLPTIWHGLKEGLKDLRGGQTVNAEDAIRTDRDLSMKFVLAGVIALVAMIMAFPQLGLQHSILTAFFGALMIVAFGFLFVTVSSRLTGEIGSSSNPISGMTVATLLLTCLIFLVLGWTGSGYYVTALSIGAIVCIAASNGGTTSQDLKTGFLVGATPSHQQVAILIGALASALVLGPILLKLNDAATVYVPVDQAKMSWRADLSQPATMEQLKGPQATADSNTYRVVHKTNEEGGPAGKYLVNEQGVPVWLVDPGINGIHKTRPDGTEVVKYDAPKATLMSYIIKGILNRQLPWGLVLLGVMIAIVLEMAGIPSLAFAVGVYLPLSSSSPIFIGGLVRWLVDKRLRRRLAHRNLTEEQLVAEGDKSPGVLMASGYIAGGAIAGILIAFMAGVLTNTDKSLTDWAKAHNPFFESGHADLLSLIPFLILTVLLYLVGREALLAGRPRASTGSPSPSPMDTSRL